MTDYSQPSDVSRVQQVFPADLGPLLPPVSQIPDEFKGNGGKWVRFAHRWFAEGFPKAGVIRRPDVDAEKAFVHLSTILGSFEPKHEHKMAAVAWLSSLWFADVTA